MVSLRARSPNNAIVHFSPSDNCDTFNPTPFLSTFISNLGFLATLKFVHSSNMASIAFFTASKDLSVNSKSAFCTLHSFS